MAKTFRRIGPRVGKNSRSTLSPLPLYDLLLVTTTDTSDVAKTTGYFNEYADIIDFKDTIQVSASDGNVFFVVTSVTAVARGDGADLVTTTTLTDKDLDDRVSAIEDGSTDQIELNTTNIAINAAAISNLTTRVEALEADSGGPVISLPGLITWAVDTGSINEGSVNSFLLLRTDYGTVPSIGGVSTVTKAGGVGTYTYRTNVDADGAMAAYASGNDITWGTTELSKLFELTSVAGVPDPSEDITLTSAASSPLGDGAATVLTVTALNTGGAEINGELNFDITAISSINESSPTVDVTILRTNGSDGAIGCTITSSNISAVGGTDYRIVNELVSMADGIVSDTINIQLFEQPITSNRTFSVELSLPTGGVTLGSGTTKQITIEWNGGFRTTGDVDWNTMDPDTLPAWTGALDFNNTPMTIDGYKIDGTSKGAEDNLLFASGTTTVALTNCYIYNAARAGFKLSALTGGGEIRNNYFNITHRDTATTSEGAPAIYYLNCQGNDDKVLGNKFTNCAGNIVAYNSDGCDGRRFQYNWTDGPTDPARDAVPGAGGANHIADIFSGVMTDWACEHNTMYQPRFLYGGVEKNNEDIITVQSSRGGSGDPLLIRYNRFLGGDETDSSTRVNMTDGASSRYIHTDYNVAIEYPHNSFGTAGGIEKKLRGNRSFSAEDKYGLPNSVAMTIARSGDYDPGEMDSHEIRGNTVVNWKKKTTVVYLENVWYPGTGTSDGLTPTHGPCGVGGGCAETYPSGWGTSRSDFGTNTSGGAGHVYNNGSGANSTVGQDGYDMLWNRRRVVIQPTNITGILVENASNLCPAGDGTLAWNATANTLTFTAYGDSAGTAFDLDDINPATNAAYTDGDMFEIFSDNTDYSLEIILDEVKYGSLDAGNQSDTDIAVVPPTSGGLYHYSLWFYAGANGDMT